MESDQMILNSATTNDDLIVEEQIYANKYMQELKFKGKTHQVFYKDPRLMLFDEAM